MAAHDRRANDPERPINHIVAGAAVDIDLMVGSNTEETRLFLLSDGSIDRITDEAILAVLAAYGLPAEALSSYRAAHPRASVGDLFSAIQTVVLAHPRYLPRRRPRDEARASHVNVRARLAPPQLGGRLGAAHGVEIRFLFDTRFVVELSTRSSTDLLLLVMSVVLAGWVGVAFLFYKNGRACEAARRGSLIANTGVGRGGSGRDKLFNGPSESEHKEETQ